MTDSDIKLNAALVGFIDLLGFKNKLNSIKTDEDLKKVYSIIQKVHDEFDYKKDKETINGQALIAKTVLSLSYAIVVAIDSDSRYATVTDFLHVFVDELFFMGVAQARCVIDGIFLRGGFSVGPFFYKNDILISQAMAKAYEIEKSKAVYPVLSFEPELYEGIRECPKNSFYSPDDDLIDILFYEYTIPNERDQKKYCLDYFRIALECIIEEDGDWTYFDFLKKHKEAVELELKKSHEPKIMEKYECVKNYHNDSIRRLFPEQAEEMNYLINLP